MLNPRKSNTEKQQCMLWGIACKLPPKNLIKENKGFLKLCIFLPHFCLYGNTEICIVTWVITHRLLLQTLTCSGDECYIAKQILLDLQKLQNDVYFRLGFTYCEETEQCHGEGCNRPFWPIFSCLPSWVIVCCWARSVNCCFLWCSVVEDFLFSGCPVCKSVEFSLFQPVETSQILLSSQGQGERATVSQAGRASLMETSDVSADVPPLPSYKLVGNCIPPPTGLLRGLVFVLSEIQYVKWGGGLVEMH